jgi:hypothetical protein
VLLACPTNEVKDYCFERWLDNVASFTYPNFAVFMADNSETKSYSKKIQKAGISVEWVKPRGKALMKRIAESHELCRRYALHFNFDYLFHLESDIFPPRTIIEDLLSMRKSVSAALYHIGQGAGSELMVQVVEQTDDEHFTATRNLGIDTPEFLDGTVKKVFHAGLGCILIHKAVLPHFAFRYEDGKNFHPDSFFAMDLYRKGIEIHVDTGIICEHDNRPHELLERKS